MRTKIPIVVFTDQGGFAANAKVTVNSRATGTQANVYTSESGGDLLPQPITCDAKGRCPGWIDRGAYTAVVSGTNVTSYNEHFDSAPASAGGIDAGWLADAIVADHNLIDFAVTARKLQQDVLPVGSVLLWWRPDNTVPLPVGYVPMDGRTLVAGQHDFPVAGSVTLTDMRNRMPLGADPALAYAAQKAAVGNANVDAPAGAPGINGQGGSHQHTLTAAQNGTHSHPITDPGHLHGGSADTQLSGLWLPNAPGGTPRMWDGGPLAINSSTGFWAPVADRTGWSMVNAGHSHNITTDTRGTGISVNNNTGAGNPHNNTPLYAGLLFIMKVKAT